VRRFLVPALPFLYSALLSLLTVGSSVYWQDSGLYLTAVHELSVLYPPGFVLYQVLCKGWTLLFSFVDFTLAVHLFSSLTAALGASAMALAVRDLLRSQGAFLRVLPEPATEDRADAAGLLSGMLLAGGYTFWFTGIYAKGYALYYLILILLLWRMIRADETGRGRDFTQVAVLIGLAWAAHPSAVLLGPAFLLFVFSQRRRLGWRGIAGRTALAAAAALGPSLLLPLIARRASFYDLGHPVTVNAWKAFVLGSRFTSLPHVFGWEATRVGSFGQFLWEEFLVLGLLLLLVGLLGVARSNQRLLGGILLWLVPYALFTILFKIEGQHDCWFVAAWMPLVLVQGVGSESILRRFPHRALPWCLALLGAGSALLVNRPLLTQKGYDLAEIYGKIYLQNLDRGAVIVLSGDDLIGVAEYLQAVKGYRPDLVVLPATMLQSGLSGTEPWYLERLLGRYPFLRPPAPLVVPPGTGPTDRVILAAAAFLNANAGCGRPVFSSIRPPPGALAPDLELTPAGTVWKLGARGRSSVDPRYWKDIAPDEKEVRRRFRRERGQSGDHTEDRLLVKPECYEQRLLEALLNAKRILAEWHFERASWAAAARLFESILESDRDPARRSVVLYYLGVSLYSMKNDARAESALLESLSGETVPSVRAGALYHLGKVLARRGDAAGARTRFRQGLAVPGLDPALREALETELKSP
jgi:hypothetical protein